LIRREAIEIVANTLDEKDIAVSANGFISRDLHEARDRSSNFYMIGSMGLASSIGLGLALKNQNKKIYVFDGDGNILMNLGSLVTIGSKAPKNFIHVIFDNNAHESTGGQPTNSAYIKIDKIADTANYTVFTTETKEELVTVLNKIKNLPGPILVLIKIEKNKYVSKRIEIEPTLIKTRFMKSIRQ
jgi:thiamine pyrophosphate-dependent acetolactate synthase large subunit-like protein